jgi:hypothetical protein
MADYYPEFREEAVLEDFSPDTDAPIDHGGDCLPFSQLSGRRFEVLVYRVKLAEHSQDDVEITLMKGVGERGLDVVVHHRGILIEVVQCKNLGTRINRDALISELCKLALHHHLRPDILGENKVRYEIWCPGGFSEPAQELINRWPASWTESVIHSYIETAIAEYAAFAHLTWHVVKDTLLVHFPARIRPTKVDGFAATSKVKRYRDIYESFFRGTVVMAREDVGECLRQMFKEGGFRQYQGDDVLDIADRMQSFHTDHRFYLGAAYFLGLTDKLLAAMTPSELRMLTSNAMLPISRNGRMIMAVVKRRIYEMTQTLCDSITYRNLSFPSVVRKALGLRATGNLAHWLPNLPCLTSAQLAPFVAMNDRALLASCVTEVWDEMQMVIAAYDPQKHPPGSDPEYRFRIGTHAIKGYSDRTIFEHELMGDVDANRLAIEALLKEILQFAPREFAVVSDTRSMLSDKRLQGRMVEASRRIAQAINRNDS